ncbi:MAG: ATP-binding protein, partial [Lentisphaeria bacterium]
SLKQRCKRPYLSSNVGFIGHGAMGGIFALPGTHGRQVVNLVCEIAEKGSAEKIALREGLCTPVFDAAVLEKNKIDLSKIPPGSVLFNEKQSFYKRHFFGMVIVSVGLIVALLLIIFYLYFIRRQEKLFRRLFALFPGGICVVNKQEKILFASLKHLPSGKKVSCLRDVENFNYEKINSCVREVFKDKETQCIDCSNNDEKYSISFVSVPKAFFGQEAVVCFLYNNKVLQEHRERLANAYNQLEAGCRITNSAVFSYNSATKKISGSSQLSDLIQIQNDSPVDSDRWIYKSDRENFKSKFHKIVAGEISTCVIHYRISQGGSIQYFQLHSKRLVNKKKEVLINGVIQNVSRIKTIFYKYQEQSKLSDFIVNSMPLVFFVKDADNSFRYILCNQYFADFLQMDKKEIIGKTDDDLFEDVTYKEEIRRRDVHAVESSEIVSYEQFGVNKFGLKKKFYVVKKGYSDFKKRNLVMGVALDITKSNRLLLSEKTNNALLSTVVRNDIDVNVKLDQMADVLMNTLKSSWIVLSKCSSDETLHLYREWNCSDGTILKKIPIEKHYEIWNTYLPILREHQLCKVSDLFQDKNYAALNLDERYKNISFVFVPVFVNEEMWGGLFVAFENNSYAFEGINNKIMFGWANFVSIIMLNERQKIALYKSDVERQLIFENIHIPLWLFDSSGNLLQHNSAVCDFFHIPNQRLSTAENKKMLAGVHSVHTVGLVEKTLLKEKSEVCNVSIGQQQYTVFSEPVFDEKDNLIYILKSAIDMTEHNNLLFRQNAMSNALEALLKEENIKEAIRKAIQIFGEYLKAKRVVLFQINMEKQTMSSFVENVTSEDDEEFFKDAQNIPFEMNPSWGELLMDRPVVFIEDMRKVFPKKSRGSFWTNLIWKRDISTVYSSRVVLDSKLWGFVGVAFDHEVHHLNSDFLDFLTSFSGFVEAILFRDSIKTKLAEALEQAKSANKSKSYFLSSVSHEIRTPLNSIIGFSELLSSGVTDPKVIKEYVDAISYSGNALLRLINDVLDLSKLEANKMQIELAPVKLPIICNEVMSIFKYISVKKNIKLIVDIPDVPKLMMDESRIRQILFNLIGNAVKFTEEGSVTLRVEFAVKEDHTATVCFLVMDTGIGVSSENLMKLTQPFVQLSHLRGTNSMQGTGLGLAITKRMIHIMNGDLEIKSTLGKGSLFKACLHDVKLAEPGSKVPAVNKSLEKNSLDGNELTVLIVDDVEMNLRVLEALLHKVGIQRVVKTSSGKAALEELKRDSFSVVLTDMWMPEMSGQELLKKIHANPLWEKIPVFAITADLETKKNFGMEGFAGVLLKPVTRDQIKKMLLGGKTLPVAERKEEE